MSSSSSSPIIDFFSQQLSTRDGLVRYGPLLFFAFIIVASLLIRFFKPLFTSNRRRPYNNHNINTSSNSSSIFKKIAKLPLGLYFLSVPAIVVSLVFVCHVYDRDRSGKVARKVLPAMFSDYSSSSIEAQLPVHPKNMTEAYEYGRIFERYQSCLSSLPTTTTNTKTEDKKETNTNKNTNQKEHQERCIANVIDSAEELYHHGAEYKKNPSLLKKRNITVSDIESIGKVISELESRKGPFQKFLSFFTLVGFLWGLSIVGICALIIPFIAIFIGDFLTKLFVKLILPLLELIWEIILKPFGGVILYSLAFWAITESSRYPTDDAYSISGIMVAFLGMGLFICAWIYVTDQISSGGGNFEAWVVITSVYLFFLSINLSIMHQSKLFSNVAVLFLLAATTFSFLTEALFTFLWRGLRHNDVLSRLLAGCFFIQIFSGVVGILSDPELIKLILGSDSFFVTSLNIVFGNNIAATNVANLISRGLVVDPFRDSFAYIGTTGFFWLFMIIAFFEDRHGDFLITCVCYVFVGFSLDLPGLMQVALFYLGSWIVLFFLCESWRRSNVVVGGFIASVALFFISNFLSNHPEYITLALFGTPTTGTTATATEQV